MNDNSQIRIVLNSVGMEKIELFALPEDNDSEELAIGLYNKLAIAIHQFSRRISRSDYCRGRDQSYSGGNTRENCYARD